MMNRITKLSGLSLVLTLVMVGTALAGGTPSGTTVDNAASVDFVVGGLPQATITSNVATFLVDNRVDVTVATLDAANIVVVPGMLARVLSYSVTNSGNTIQDYTLTPVADAGDDFDAANVNVFVDSNGNDTYEPALDNTTFVDELGIDATITVFIVSDIPLAALNADLANYDLLAQTSAGATPGVSGVAYAADNVAIIDPVPANTSFVVGSHTVAPAGTVEYSNDSGATWTHVPVDSGDTTDPTVTHMRISYASVAAATGALSTFTVIIQ